MPPKHDRPDKTLEQIVAEVGLYPIEAYEFVQRGLAYTVQKLHARKKDDPKASKHVSGQQLSEGLKEFALLQWGLLARTVLARWNIHRTDDFGRIVFSMVENGWMSKTDQDNIEDFRAVFDFASAFDEGYRIECKA
jgi:uncharacterized repeat protein (TIGR04138 family)